MTDSIKAAKGMTAEEIELQLAQDDNLNEVYETFCEAYDIEKYSEGSYEDFSNFVNS